MRELSTKFAENAVLESSWLSSVDFGWGPERIKDAAKGIHNPRGYAGTLTIVTDPNGEYDDGEIGNSLYQYSYERRPDGQDELGGSNKKLREAMKLGLPIVMLRKVSKGKYVPIMPVYVVKDDQVNRRFLLAIDEGLRFLPDPANLTDDQRRYAQQLVNVRIHQPEFRSKVLTAYKKQCAVCQLQKVPLLDAAHITPDSAEGGLPIVANGLALCMIHHGAYDAGILGISPDYQVHIDQEVLLEVDGPMLKHGLQEMNLRRLWVPDRAQDRPDQERLAERFEKFLHAS